LLSADLHQLHVAADDRERRLQVVDDAGEEAPDGRQPVLVLARLARELEADRGRRVRGDEHEELAVLVVEAGQIALVVERDRAERLPLAPLRAERRAPPSGRTRRARSSRRSRRADLVGLAS
jgi:hypothetical protein